MLLGEFVEEARRDRGLPEAVDAPVGGEVDAGAPLGPRDAHIGETPFLFEARPAVVVERALMREEPFLPARQEDGFEFETLGAM